MHIYPHPVLMLLFAAIVIVICAIVFFATRPIKQTYKGKDTEGGGWGGNAD